MTEFIGDNMLALERETTTTSQVFDTLACVKRLGSNGFTPQQAAALADGLSIIRHERLAQIAQFFNTLAYAKKMESVGFTRQQAETLAEELGHLIDERLALCPQ